MTMNAAVLTVMPTVQTASAEAAAPTLRNERNVALHNQKNQAGEGIDGSVQGEPSHFEKTLQKQLNEDKTNSQKEPKSKRPKSKSEELPTNAATMTVPMPMPSESSIKATKKPEVFASQRHTQNRTVQAATAFVKPVATEEKKQVATHTPIDPPVAKSSSQTPSTVKSRIEPAIAEKTPANPVILEQSDKPAVKAVDGPAMRAAQTDPPTFALPKAAVDKSTGAEQTLKEGAFSAKESAKRQENVLHIKPLDKSESAASVSMPDREPTESEQPKGQAGHGLKSSFALASDKAKTDSAALPMHAQSKDAAGIAEQIGRAFQAAESPSANTTNSVQNVPQLAAARAIADTAALRPADQIVQTMQLRTFGAEQELRMTLAPQELGAIRLTFRHTEGQVVGLLEVQNNQTRRELEQSVAQLTAAMENAGLQVRRIEIVPWAANTQQQSLRGDMSGQGFDAAGHQQMYRSFEERNASSTVQHGRTEGLHAQTSNTSTSSPTDDRMQTGLNLFI